ncbi:hypothetical protein [Aliiroseovarius sp. YM-037]|uniref:hypothetical protein n=1 Tax=Aliiroseovarius sp. YM-037 TaxID=3341728 RepID=UPI003A80185A
MTRLIVLFACLAGPVWGDVNQGGRTIDCYCTDKVGARVELGEEICLFVDGRAFMARCEMSLNNPMWRETGRACVSSKLQPPMQSVNPAADPGGIDAEI